MNQQTPQLVATAVRNPAGKFQSWEMYVDGTKCSKPATCTVNVAHGNNALITVTVSDPKKPSTDPAITFSSNPILVPPTVEIHDPSKPQPTTLKFGDHNWHPGTIKYQLNFDTAPPIDPIIQNGGGGPPHRALGFIPLPTTQQQLAIDLGIAFILGIIVALIVRRVF